MAQTTYDVGSGLEVPGLEAVIELGQVNSLSEGAVDTGFGPNGRLLGSPFALNDQSVKERARVQNIDGLYDDPESQEQRTKLPDRHGERPGLMTYAGRTIGLTGVIEAGSINAMRDVARRVKRLLPESESTMILHPVGEVAEYRNVCPDPLGASTSVTWDTNSTSTGTPTRATVTDGVLSANELAVASATASGAMLSYPANAWLGSSILPAWFGEDLWVHGRVKVQAASAAVTNLQLLLIPYTSPTTPVTASAVVVQTQTSPTTGTWYSLAATVAASALPANTTGLAVAARLNYGAAGSFTLRWTRMALVPIPVGKIAPLGYFDGTFPGFSWEGATPNRSRGPHFAANQVRDPFGAVVASWEANNTSGVTVNQAPLVAGARSGIALLSYDIPSTAIYYRVTNPDTTSRTLAIRTAATNSADRFVAAANRTYSVQAALNVLQKPATTQLTVTWLDQAGAVLSTSVIATLATGVQTIGPASVIAPAGSVQAYLSVSATTSTSGAVLELFITRVSFCDVTTHGQAVVGDEDYALLTVGLKSQGARCPIKRPWMMRNVRKASYAAPEKQSNLKPVRDFTCSLRASDPRIYRLDEHNVQLQLTGTPNFVSLTPPVVVNNSSYTTTPAPTGFTSDLAASGGTATYVWTQTTIPTPLVA